MSLDPNENTLVIGTRKGWILTYNLESIINGKPDCLTEFESHKEAVRQVIIRDRGFDLQLLSISVDGVLKIQTIVDNTQQSPQPDAKDGGKGTLVFKSQKSLERDMLVRKNQRTVQIKLDKKPEAILVQ